MFYLEVKDMYNKGEFVVKATNGICEIVDVTTMNLSGENKEYYVLVPIGEKASKVFVPVATAENKIRPAMKKEDAWKFIKEINTVEEVLIENEKEREKLYKEAINSCNPKCLVSILKELYLRRKKRLEDGRKLTNIDERYFKMAENQLYSELAFALGVHKSEIDQIIEENVVF